MINPVPPVIIYLIGAALLPLARTRRLQQAGARGFREFPVEITVVALGQTADPFRTGAGRSEIIQQRIERLCRVVEWIDMNVGIDSQGHVRSSIMSS